jgi:hypothetical protein
VQKSVLALIRKESKIRNPKFEAEARARKYETVFLFVI